MRLSEIAHDIRPFDLVLVRGTDAISIAVSKLQEFKLDDGSYSHVGMIVTSRVLPFLKDGILYIWESTASGSYGDGVPDIANRTVLGVQIRELTSVIEATLAQGGKIAIARLLHNPTSQYPRESDAQHLVRLERLSQMMQRIFLAHRGQVYQFMLCDQCCALFGWCRSRYRNRVRSKATIFCSELIAEAYKQLGVLPDYIVAKNVVPMDFLGFDQDGMPKIVHEPIELTSV